MERLMQNYFAAQETEEISDAGTTDQTAGIQHQPIK